VTSNNAKLADFLVSKWLRPALTVALIALIGLVYLVYEPFRVEANRAVSVLASGNIEAVRDWLSFRLSYWRSRMDWRSGRSGADY
jgi:hypothetical protein